MRRLIWGRGAGWPGKPSLRCWILYGIAVLLGIGVLYRLILYGVPILWSRIPLRHLILYSAALLRIGVLGGLIRCRMPILRRSGSIALIYRCVVNRWDAVQYFLCKRIGRGASLRLGIGRDGAFGVFLRQFYIIVIH